MTAPATGCDLFGRVDAAATLSPCRRYRYELHRTWADGPVCGWIMCNPSTADLYWERAGIDLTREPLVLVGSVCRRQGMDEAGRILTALHTIGVTRLHGLGFKTLGLIRFADLLTSADSLAWSDTARKLHRPAFPHCVGVHKNCANCLTYALSWRRTVLAAAEAGTPQQQTA